MLRAAFLWKAVVDVPCNLQRVVEDSTMRCRLHGTSTTALHTFHTFALYKSYDDNADNDDNSDAGTEDENSK